MQKTRATHSDVAGTAVQDREDELGDLHGDHDPGLSLPRRLWPLPSCSSDPAV